VTAAAVVHAGKCPHCGADLEFHVGSSRAAVCEYCHTLVARRGQDFAAVGRVADLIPTGARLVLHDTGTWEGTPFRLVGRLQYQWRQGTWDEWYIALQDGRWGWLAEAQGRYYVTFRTGPRKLPAADQVSAGRSIIIDGFGRYVATDVKQAQIVGAAGELPSEIQLGSTPLTVDLEGPRGAFATIDYGDRTGPPVLFAGKQIHLADLAIHDEGAAQARQAGQRPEGEKLKCPNCQAPVEVRVPGQTVRLVCESCNAMLDASEGPLQLITVLQRFNERPPIPLGTTGNLRGVELIVVGWMRRSCTVEGVDYPWDELLLYDPKSTGFCWLLRSDGHWQLAEPISAAEVLSSGGSDAVYEGKRYVLFSRVEGWVEEVLGEFYWEVAVGDTAHLDDYIAPPHGLSRESTGREVSWSYLTHLDAIEVGKAFHRPEIPHSVAAGVGEVQPWPHEKALAAVDRWMIGALGAAFLLFFLFVARGSSIALDNSFDFSLAQWRDDPRVADTTVSDQAAAPAAVPCFSNPKGGCSHSFLSEPFTLTGTRAIEVALSAPAIANSWVSVEGAVIPAEGGEGEAFDLESAFYSGQDSDGAWAEGNRRTSIALPSLGSGQYVVRADFQWDPKAPKAPTVQMTLREGGYSGWQFLFVLAALSLGLFGHVFRASFEKERWENANVPHFGGWNLSAGGG
jgi:hypothetical protein